MNFKLVMTSLQNLYCKQTAPELFYVAKGLKYGWYHHDDIMQYSALALQTPYTFRSCEAGQQCQQSKHLILIYPRFIASTFLSPPPPPTHTHVHTPHTHTHTHTHTYTHTHPHTHTHTHTHTHPLQYHSPRKVRAEGEQADAGGNEEVPQEQ